MTAPPLTEVSPLFRLQMTGGGVMWPRWMFELLDDHPADGYCNLCEGTGIKTDAFTWRPEMGEVRV